MNGFKLSNLPIEPDAIESAGSLRDGIPSINQPKFILPDKVEFLQDADMPVDT